MVKNVQTCWPIFEVKNFKIIPQNNSRQINFDKIYFLLYFWSPISIEVTTFPRRKIFRMNSSKTLFRYYPIPNPHLGPPIKQTSPCREKILTSKMSSPAMKCVAYNVVIFHRRRCTQLHIVWPESTKSVKPWPGQRTLGKYYKKQRGEYLKIYKQ